MKKRMLALLLAALMVLALAACGGSEREAAPTEAGAQTVVNDGATLTIPEEYKDLVVVQTPENDPLGYLFIVSEKASVEAGKKQGHDENWADGWLFSIGRVDDDYAKEMRCGDMSGAEFFAKTADGMHYVLYHPTDVRLVREDYSNIPEEDMKQWSALNAWAADAVPAAFIADNAGLEAEAVGNSDLDVVFARIAFQSDVNYMISTLDYGPLDPSGVDAKPFLDKLMNGVTYDYTDDAAPDGEYVVLSFPDEGVRYDFFRADGNLVRRVYDNDDYAVLYRATFADGTTQITDVMQAWYDAIAAQRDMDLLGYTPDSLLGRWAEKIAGRGLITISKGDAEGEYQVEIVWSSSAAEQAVWEMTARPVASNALRYAGGRHAVRTYSADGSFTEEVKYENGTGIFTLNSANEIMWQDDIDHAGDDTVFISAESLNKTK